MDAHSHARDFFLQTVFFACQFVSRYDGVRYEFDDLLNQLRTRFQSTLHITPAIDIDGFDSLGEGA